MLSSAAPWLAAMACLNLAAAALPVPADARAIPFCGTPPPGWLPPGHREPARPPLPGGGCHVILCAGDREKDLVWDDPSHL
ncbi:hypothetical protein [Sphingobium sp. WCS2017Hpa-17]|uniref:hypothetical protein n=1 Tax=Sphingobium sp. WCS2017Hpa-17 TaxID=3073638 RepID=UPI00288C31A1|nr:hypothetical protein [Sphingobium sp. WCS2017Hpa-17]